jgi:general secretion pathway protein I
VSEPRADGGFTLIEVLVALTIVAVGMAAVMGALTSSASTAAYLRDKTFAQWVALNQIANLRLSGQQPPTGKSDGDTDFAGRTWHWHQEVVTTELPGVERIDVSVRPADLKVDSDDKGWVTTVSGIWGDAVGTPNGWQPDWGSQTVGGPPAGPGGPTTGGNPTGAPTTPTPNPPTPSPRGTQ